MPGSFNHKEILELARKAEVSPKAAERLCGVCRVKYGESDWQIGLNLFDSDFFTGQTRADLVDESSAILKTLRGLCPKVFGWACRGDFNPHKPPTSIKRGELLHCARTAARLRAEALRGR